MRRFATGWHAPRWLLPALILALALGIGFTTPFVVVQAQDGGTQSGQNLSANFVLQVDASNPKLNNLCLGETVSVPVTVRMRTATITGGADIGRVTVRSADITATVTNPSIVSAMQTGFSSDPDADAPFQAHINLKGEATGSTTVTLNASVESDIVVSYDEEVALPIPITSQADPEEVPVRVVPCIYRVTINSIWETSMHGAFTILIANVHNARLRSDQSLDTLVFEPPVTGPPFLEWTWANNRIIGCWASGGHFNTQAPTIRAQRLEEGLVVNLSYLRSVPGDGNSQYYRSLCLPHFSGEPCSDHPDGYCFTLSVDRPIDWFEPQPAQDLFFDLDGETVTTTHLINHSWGSANGTTIITLTPERVSGPSPSQ